VAVWRRLVGAGAALVLLGGAVLLGGGARSAAQGGATFEPDPLVLVVGANQVQTVALRIANVQHLWGGQVYLQFDPSVVEVVDADPSTAGTQIAPGGFPPADSILVNAADNISGTIDYAVTSLNPTPESNGSGIFCTITFRGKVAGRSTALALRASPETILAVVNGASVSPAPYVWQDGTIRVNYMLYLSLVTRGGPYYLYLPIVMNGAP
jgi:hypothetical protein